jgi:2,4-dienoyl-CoA reductase-like NADH-dependent reductase (Old Yellow Enzyme family)
MVIAEAAVSTRSPQLLEPFAIRGLTLKNRIVVSSMATYGSHEGFTDDFLLVHLGRFALGGAGLVMTESMAVTRQGRITYGCSGLWTDAQVPNLRRIVDFLHRYDCAAGIQLNHSGRKGSSQRPWHGGAPLTAADQDARREAAWLIMAPTAEPFDDGWPEPQAFTTAEIDALVEDYRAATVRAREAGFDVMELHCAHGYLLHSFLSPLANKRNDAYGGSLENRMRLPLTIAEAMRAQWPDDKPLFTRISSVDGLDIGWSMEDSIVFCRELVRRGVDAIDCSSGGMKLPRGQQLVSRAPGFQVPFAARIRRELNVPTMAVGLIREPEEAEAILESGDADLIAVGREMLVNPNWAILAALSLKGEGRLGHDAGMLRLVARAPRPPAGRPVWGEAIGLTGQGMPAP